MTPNRICFIWLGSDLQPKHQYRLKTWRAFNREHCIELWIARECLKTEQIDSLVSFCLEHGIVLRDVSELTGISQTVSLCLNNMLKQDRPNMGALSDIYRFYILRDGGWYFDTDVTPKKTLPLHITLNYGFALNLKKVQDGFSIFPDQLVVSTENHFIPKCIEVIEHMVGALDINKLVHPSIPQICWANTEHTTGSIILSAVQKLTFEHGKSALVFKPEPCIRKPEITLSYALHEIDYFETIKREGSWLLSRFPGEDLRLTTDEKYINEIQTKVARVVYNIGMGSAILPPQQSVSAAAEANELTAMNLQQEEQQQSLVIHDDVILYLTQQSIFQQAQGLTKQAQQDESSFCHMM